MKRIIMVELHGWSGVGRVLVKLERKRILPILKRNGIRARLFHVGSTSVRGLGGKGVPDMLLVLASKGHLKKAMGILSTAGYRHNPNAGDRERKFMNIERPYKGRLYHMHMHIMWKGTRWREMVAFRMLLSRSPEIRREYWELKKNLSDLPPEEYTKRKSGFIREMTNLAMERYGKSIRF